jgi:hypothetical protein
MRGFPSLEAAKPLPPGATKKSTDDLYVYREDALAMLRRARPFRP